MVVRFEDPRERFERRVNNLEAKASSLLNAPAPGVYRKKPQKSWHENGFVALFYGMLVLVAVRLFMFHVPELVGEVQAYGLSPGLVGAYLFPVAVALIAAWAAGHFRDELWVPSLFGIGFILICEYYVMMIFPDIWGIAYSPDFVAFSQEGQGALSGWLDAQAVLPDAVTPGAAPILDIQDAVAPVADGQASQ